MKLDLEKYRILITPENEMEESYLESMLNLKEDGDEAQAVRVNAHDLSCWAYLEITPKETEVNAEEALRVTRELQKGKRQEVKEE